ncbi:MAG: DNA double-strand break repair nuclease NurA [Thermoprotei archaeon]
MDKEIIEWIKLPQDLQHKFFELASKEAEELTSKISSLKIQLESLRSLIEPYMHKLNTNNKVFTIAAVDSSRSPRLSERLGIRYGVIAGGVVFLEGVEKRNEDFLVGVFKRKQALSQDKSKYYFDILSTYIERKLALSALDKCDLLILDGSFYGFVYPVQRMKKAGLYGTEEEEKIKEILDITEKLKISGKAIGIIKRSHTRALGGYLAHKEKRNNIFTTIIDKLILSHLMHERTVFNYHDLIGDYPVQLYTQIALLVSRGSHENRLEENLIEEAKKKVYSPFKALNIQRNIIDDLRRVQVKFYKDLPPCEIEFPSSISVDKLLEFLGQENMFNDATNLPIALDLVDSLVMLPAKFTEEFVSEVEGRVLEFMSKSKEYHDTIKLFFTLLNPQKIY